MSAVAAPASRRRLTVVETSVPTMARGTRLRHDGMRQRWVLLVPERVLAPDDIAVEVLQLCDGKRNVGAMIDELATKYLAPREQIGADVVELLQELANSGFLVDAQEERP